MPILAVFIFFAAIVTGVVLLQIFLSKGNNKLLGLILPVVFFIISFVGIHGMTSYASGESAMNIGSLYIVAVITYPIFNIPTGILLLVYIKCRDKRRLNSRSTR